MQRDVEEHTSSGNRSEQTGTIHTTFELHSVGDTPAMSSTRNPASLRTVAKDPEHCARVLNVSEGAHR
jgi:hypothetical protein